MIICYTGYILMKNQYLFQSKFFLIFLLISACVFSAIPVVKHSFKQASDTYVKERMHYVQTELFFYDLHSPKARLICSAGEMTLLQNEIIFESGNTLSCSFNKETPSLSLYTLLQRNNETYCVDTLGYAGVIDTTHPVALGRCSK